MSAFIMKKPTIQAHTQHKKKQLHQTKQLPTNKKAKSNRIRKDLAFTLFITMEYFRVFCTDVILFYYVTFQVLG